VGFQPTTIAEPPWAICREACGTKSSSALVFVASYAVSQRTSGRLKWIPVT